MTGERAPSLEEDGYTVLAGAVAPAAVEAALRLLNLAIRNQGLSAEEILACQSTTFFPDLRDHPAVWGVLPPAAGPLLGMGPGDEWAEPQILLRFPDEPEDWPLEPHIDEPPPWAPGRGYKGIVGVALTTAGADDGAPCVWPGSHRAPGRGGTGGDGGRQGHRPVPLQSGDAVVMDPALEHAGTLNRGGRVRYAVYFRLLEAPPGDP